MFFGGRSGGNITVQRISFADTLKEILAFTTLYALAGLLQLLIVSAVAVVLGVFCGPVFACLAIALEFKPCVLIDVRPLRIGFYIENTWHNRVKPRYVLLTQCILGLVGVGAIIALLTGYFPTAWPWRFDWLLESRWPWADTWHAVTSNEVVARALLLVGVPFIGWPSVLILKWASKKEVTSPTARETPYGRRDPSTMEGPHGERYRRDSSSDSDDGDDVVILPPEY